MLICELNNEEIIEVNPRKFEERRYFRQDSNYPKCPIESVRTYNRKPFCLEEHLKRLFRSAEAIGVPLPAGILKFIRNMILRIIEQAPFDPQFLRITATPKNVLIVSRELEIDPQIYEEGVAVTTTILKQKRDFHVKIAERDELEEAYQLARKHNFFECLLVNREGEITEGTRSNVLWVRNDVIYWCPYALDGITQATVIQLAASHKAMPIHVKQNYHGGFHLGDLDYIQEMFITLTSKGIVPVTRINRKLVGSGNVGPLTYLLMEKFNTFAKAA